jgi:hypothetical protein
MTTITVQINSKSKLEALLAFLNSLKINFNLQETDQKYNSEFVEKINESRKQIENGQVVRVEKENLKEYLGL